ncbi:Ldh family oxidoreductase, partial [Klebsiella pneumoniae]|uniref:Ldh family oxidoreductase n=2 Tax=Pseudomonadota TaxID=1224 RepID=UPI0013D3FEDB
YTTGELGYYVRRLADAGLVAFAATNSPALMASGKSREAVFGTNPLAFAAPSEDSRPLVIDQASSATAFVTIRQLAEQGEQIPEG